MQRILATALIGLAFQFTAAIHAGGTDAAARPLQVTIMQEPAQFDDPYYCAFITVGESKFTFIVPQDYHLKSDPATGTLLIGNTEGDCSISFAILRSSSFEEGPITAESCREAALKMHPDGKILQGFSASVLGKSGQGVDVRWKPTDDLYECERVAFIPTPFGTFLFTAVADPKDFAKTQANLSVVMRTFQSSTDGKFHPVHIQTVN